MEPNQESARRRESVPLPPPHHSAEVPLSEASLPARDGRSPEPAALEPQQHRPPASEARASQLCRIASTIFAANRSLGSAFARLALSPAQLASLGERILKQDPEWLAKHLHAFRRAGDDTLRRWAGALLESGAGTALAYAAGRSGLVLDRATGLRLASQGHAAEVLSRARHFELTDPAELSTIALRLLACGDSRAVENAVWNGMKLELPVGMELAKINPGFVLRNAGSFSITKTSHASRVAELALDRGELNPVKARLERGGRVEPIVADRLLRMAGPGRPELFRLVARNLQNIEGGTDESLCSLAGRLLDAGYERSLLVAQSKGQIRLPLDIANRLLERQHPLWDICVLRQLALFVDKGDASQLARFDRHIDRIIRTYGIETLMPGPRAPDVPVLARLEDDLKLRTLADAKARLPEAAHGVLVAMYPEIRAQKDPLRALHFCRGIEKDISSLLSAAIQDQTLPQRPYYRAILDYALPNNSGGYTNFTRNEANPDRSADISAIKRKAVYRLCEYADEKLVRKESAPNRPGELERIERGLQSVAAEIAQARAAGGDAVAAGLDKLRGGTGRVEGPVEARLVEALLSGLEGRASLKATRELVIQYHLAGGGAPPEACPERPYLHYRRLEGFFDQIARDTIPRIAGGAIEAGRDVASDYARALAILRGQSAATISNRADPQKLVSGGRFLGRVERILGGAEDLEAKLRSIAEICSGAERDLKQIARACLGLARASGTPAEIRENGLRKMIAGEKRKAAQLISGLRGGTVDESSIDLSSLDLEQFSRGTDACAQAADGEALRSFLELELERLFAPDLQALRHETAAYVPEGQRNAVPIALDCILTKNHTAAHGPQTSGVCTTGEADIWRDPGHSLLLLKDRNALKCVGAVLLFSFEDQGKKILAASMNPSSTYLLKVDERALFNSLFSVLKELAKDNGHDIVAISTERQMRGNRFDCDFEREMLAKSQDRPVLALHHPHVVSLERRYVMQNLVCLWSREEG